ncbi:unnamed protein product, partial [marine sediment metagenome]
QPIGVPGELIITGVMKCYMKIEICLTQINQI